MSTPSNTPMLVLLAVLCSGCSQPAPTNTMAEPAQPTGSSQPAALAPKEEGEPDDDEQPEPTIADPELSDALYEGVAVDIAAPTGSELSAARLTELVGPLGFVPTDDYLAIRDGDDEPVVFLLPLVDGEAVHNHAGPFDAVRLEFSVLRNAPEHVDKFMTAVEHLIRALNGEAQYATRNHRPLTGLEQVAADIRSIQGAWREVGVEPGSDAALMVDF